MTIHEKRARLFPPGRFKAERLRRWSAWLNYRATPTISNALKVHYGPGMWRRVFVSREELLNRYGPSQPARE